MELSNRLAEIIIRLSSGQKLSINALAEEFRVSKRTIQRDLHERLIHLPIQQEGQFFWVDTAYLGRFSFKHLTKLMQFLGLDRLCNKWDIAMLATLANGEKPWSLLPEQSEILTQGLIQNLDRLESSIQERYTVQFNYNEKKYSVQPYRLMFAYGRWYLIGLDKKANTIKSFIVRKIVSILSSGVKFEPAIDIIQKIENAKSPWLGDNFTQVTLRINGEFSEYFEQKQIFPEQKVEQKNKDGSLIISCRALSQRHIFPHIRYWMPYIQIEKPIEWKTAFIHEINEYLSSNS